MPSVTLKCDFSLPLDAAVEDVWAFCDSREAQQELHPHIDRISVVEGAWGEVGCAFVTSGVSKNGEPFTVEQRITEVDRPHRYVTQLSAPDLTTNSTVIFDIQDGRVIAFSQQIEVQTRNLSLSQYAAVKLQSGAIKQDASDDFLVAYAVLQRYLIEECGYGGFDDLPDSARA